MTVPFEVFGPYDIDRKEVFEAKWQKDGWAGVDEEVGQKLSEAAGVYVFSLRHGETYLPLYVGSTTQQGFRKEVFNKSNLVKIAHDWAHLNGAISLHLLTKRKKIQKGFSKSINADWINSLEVLLIFLCRRRNPNLANKKHTVWLDGIGIRGITTLAKNKGKPLNAVSTLKAVIGW